MEKEKDKNYINEDNNNLLEFYYECNRCYYKSTNLSDIKKHLNRKKKCEKNNEECELDGIELFNKSIEKKYVNEKKIIKNFEEDKINNIKYEENQCIYCKKIFSLKTNLNNHLKICIIKDIIEKDQNQNKIKNNINFLNKFNIVNNTNNKIEKNINNNNDELLIINLKKEKNNENEEIISFFKDFDISHIDEQKMIDLVLSNLYIESFYELMKNRKNQNFLFIDNSMCYVYKDEIEKYILLENVFVYTNLIKKIKNFLIYGLQKMYELKSYYHIDHFKISEYHIKKKYNDYIKGEDIIYIDKFKNEINLKWEEYANICREKYNKIQKNNKKNNLLKNI